MRREKTPVHSGESPARELGFAPPGSNRSSGGGNEATEASGVEGRFRRLGEYEQSAELIGTKSGKRGWQTNVPLMGQNRPPAILFVCLAWTTVYYQLMVEGYLAL